MSSAYEPTSPTAASAASATGGTSPADASAGELVKQVSEDLQRLVRNELKLAQVELTEKAKHAGKGVGAFGGAGVLGLYGLGVLIAAAVLALALVMDAWLAALIVAIVLFLIAGAMALFGRKQVQEATPATPTQTVESVKEDVREIKESIKND